MSSFDGRDGPAIALAALLDTTDDAVATTDLTGNVASWNAAAERLFGFTAAETVGRTLTDIFATRLDDERQLLELVRRGESLRRVSAVRRRKDGTHVPIALTVVPLRDTGGTIVGSLRIANDLTDYDRTDRAARRLAAIVESSDDAIVSKDLNGIVTSWNRGAEQIFGYTAAEMIGRSIRTIIPADRQTEEDTVLAAIRRGDKVDHFETVRQHKNGTLIPISLSVSPIKDATGLVIGASKIARDISERKRADVEREQLLAIARENAAITDKLNKVGAVVASGLDRTTIVQAVTDAATELTTAEFGAFFYNLIDERGEAYTLFTISGVPRELFSRFPMPRNTAVFEPTFRGRAIVRSDDITKDPRYGHNAPHYGMPAGHLPVRSYLAVPVRSRSDEVLGGLFFGHSSPGVFDERHERLAVGIASWAAVALENARLYADVQQASRLKDDFLATLSHELRTPLNAILGYARMIRSGIVPAERFAKAVETIERNAASLTQIVEDILDVSRIISGKLRLAMQAVDVADVARHAMEAIAPAAHAKGIQLESHVDPDTPAVSADPERLQQVVWNLLSNAVKFTGRGGTIALRIGEVDGQVEICLRDTGIGIKPEFLPHLFERFRQADASTTRERGGLGLGLSIARQLVEMHGGTIEAASEGVGRGSTFRVRLPVIAPADGRDDERSDAPFAGEAFPSRLPDLHGVRVLAVDDDRDALQMMREILQAAGAHVSTADAAQAALDAIDAVHPDVLVSDVGMPRMDGFDLIARIRSSPKAAVRALPAVAVTAYARSEDRARALRSGYQMHLSKPIDPAELLASVASLAQRAAPSH